jgi:hypothetical protein
MLQVFEVEIWRNIGPIVGRLCIVRRYLPLCHNLMALLEPLESKQVRLEDIPVTILKYRLMAEQTEVLQ